MLFSAISRAHIKEFRILNNIESRSVTIHRIVHQICVDKTSNLNGINSKTINIKWRRKENFMRMKINSLFYVLRILKMMHTSLTLIAPLLLDIEK